jgi:hypothetical protein
VKFSRLTREECGPCHVFTCSVLTLFTLTTEEISTGKTSVRVVEARILDDVPIYSFHVLRVLLMYNMFIHKHCMSLGIIKHQQMYFKIIKKFNIFLGTLLHVSASWCHPQGALSSWLKLHTIMA